MDMKKNILTIVLFAVAMIYSQESSAQFRFGLRGGLNISKENISGDLKDNFTSKGRPGYYVGPTLEYTIPKVGFGADLSLLYDNKNMQLGNSINSNYTKKSLHYIDVPFNLRWNINFRRHTGIYIATGPQLQWLINNSLSDFFSDKDYQLKKSQFSWNIGAGFNLGKHFRIGYTYNIGIGNTTDINNIGDVWNGVVDNASFQSKTNTHQVLLSLFF